MKILDVLAEIDQQGNEPAYNAVWFRPITEYLGSKMAHHYMRFVRELQEVCDYETV